MKNKAIILIIFLGFFDSCKQKGSNSKSLTISFSKEWKSDTLGCLGNRQKIVNEKFDSLKQFIGKPNINFTNSFGNPNLIKLVGNEKEYLYWISCSQVPIVKGIKGNKINPIPINKEATYIIVQIDSTKKIKSVKLIVP